MVSRRITLQIALALPLVASFWPSLQAHPAGRLGQQVRRLFRNPAAAGAIGEFLQRRSFPDSSLPSLLDALRRGRSDLAPIPPAIGEPALRAALQQRISADFRAGDTLWCEGWLLAVTEAHLLMIAHHTAASREVAPPSA